jgi:hypothetical protein
MATTVVLDAWLQAGVATVLFASMLCRPAVAQ